MESNLFLLFLRPLERAGLRYAVTGSVAGMIYGEPRLTHDIDVVIDLPLDRIDALAEQFSEDEFYVPPPEVIAIEVQRAQRGHFNLIHQATGFKADFYPKGRDPLHAWALGSARTIDLEGVAVRDIEAMLAQLGEGVDRSEIDRRVEELRLEPQWRRLREP